MITPLPHFTSQLCHPKPKLPIPTSVQESQFRVTGQRRQMGNVYFWRYTSKTLMPHNK